MTFPRGAVVDAQAALGLLLDQIIEILGNASSTTQERDSAVEALFLFPVLAQSESGQLRKDRRVREAYVKVTASNNPVHYIICTARQRRLEQQSYEEAAKQHRSPLPAPASVGRPSPALDAKAIKRVITLTKADRPAAAVRTIEQFDSLGVIPNPAADPAVREKLSSLHPPANQLDDIPVLTPPPAALRLDMEHVTQGLLRLPRQSAAGMDCWTYDLIRQLVPTDREEEGSDLLVSIAILFEHILAGRGGSASLWTSSRLIPLSKKDGGVRPIAIGAVWYRFLGRVVATAVSTDLGKALLPLQYGIGVKGGAEAVAHACSIAQEFMLSGEDDLEDPFMVQTVDFKNAFNTIRRGTIARAVLEHAPNLYRFFCWAYGSESPLFSNDGSLLATSCTGVRQGDPLGPLFFCLGLHSLLKKLQDRFPKVSVLAYIDDVTIVGPGIEALAALHFIQRECGSIGLEVNSSKSLRWCGSDEHGVVILGTPIGNVFSLATSFRAPTCRLALRQGDPVCGGDREQFPSTVRIYLVAHCDQRAADVSPAHSSSSLHSNPLA